MSTTTSATKFKVHIHDGSFSLEELLVSPEWFSEIDDGTVVSLEFFSNSNDVDEKVAGGKRLLLRAKHFDVGSEGSSKRMQLSLLKRVAEARNLAPWMSATVTPIKDAERHGVEHVEFSFRDQFISRAEIWKFKKCVESEPVYVGKYFDVNGVRATASELRGKAGQLVDSALLSEHTKLIFRSRSTRIFWLVQMSYEMWEPNVGVDDDFLYVERIVDVFAAPLLKRWRQLDVTHSLSVLFFTRIENVDGDGKYEDLYRVALENKQADRIDEVALVASLKRELAAFATSLAMRQQVVVSALSPTPVAEDKREQSRNSRGGLIVARAAVGNVLEAINLTLNVLDKHYLDRDLKRTGNSIVLLSAGAGVFTVDPSLAQTTKQRMLDNGIGMDMLSLAVPPLHTTPVFIHRREENGQQSGDFDYEIPHWINLRFVDPSQAQDPRAWIAAAAPRRAREGWRMEPLSLHTPRRHEPESPIHFSPARRRQYTGDKDPAGAKLARMPSALAFLVDSYSECAQELQSLSSSDSRDDCNDIPPSTTGKKSVNALVANKSTGMHGSVDEEKPEGRPKHPSKDDFSSLFDSEFISESRFSASSSEAWRPTIYIGSISRSARDEHNYRDVGGYGAMSGITHATQSPPESTPTKGAGSIDKSVVDHAEVVLEENAARSAKYQEEATNGKIIAESYAELSKQSASMRPDDARSADPCKIVAGGGGNYSLQSRNSHNFAATESSSVIHEDAATFLQAQASYKHERRNSRSPSRHSFDKHDDAVFTNNSFAVHDERKPVSSDALFKQPSTQNSSLSSGNRMSNTNQSARSAHHRHGRKTRPKAVVQNFDRPKDIFASSQDNEQKAGSQYGPQGQHQHHTNETHSQLAQELASKNVPQSDDRKTEEKPPQFFLNPFKREDEQKILNHSSYNRRRWSQIFSEGEEEFRNSVTGPNWRSLITPAVLPLETDFQSLPPEQWVGEKAKKYTENHYTCWLPEGMEEKCVEMMIAQRIAQDYQIAPFTTQAKMSSTRGRINNKKWQDKVGGNMSGASQTICVLSMGHREHKFERESQNEMKVYYRNYVPTTNKQEHNNGDNKGDNKVDQKKKEEHTYTYSLWLSNSDGATSKSNVQGTFVTQTQTFSGDRFQTIWNHLDEVIAGELPAKHVMNEIKWRIVLFAIIPDFSIETDDHLRRFDKFEEFLNSKRDDSSEELTAVRSRLGSGMSTTRGATENGVGPVREPQILRVSLDKDDPWEWVALECDGEIDVDAKRCYKFAVRWLLCSGWVVDEFLTSLSRKAKQIGIKLVQIPHYSRELDVHPFVAHALLVKASTDRVRYLVEGALVERYGFVLYVMSESKEKVARKRKFHSRQESSGTKTDVSQLTSNLDIKSKTRDPDTHQQPFPTKSTFLRQYIHSSGSAFIRVYEDGTFGWVKNRLRNPYASIKVTSYDSHDNILREIREHAAILGLIDSLLSNIIDNVQEM